MQSEMSDILHAMAKEKMPKSSTLKKDAQDAISIVDRYIGPESEFYSYVKKNPLMQIPFIKFLQETSTKNKLFFHCFNIIHKLVTRNSLSKEFIPHILEELEKKMQQSPEMRLKVLQLLQPLILDPHLVKGALLQKLFKIGIRLIQDTKSTMGTAGAARVTVCTVVDYVFERPSLLSGEEKERAESDCAEITRVSLECAKEFSMLGLDLLMACISNEFSKEVFKSEPRSQVLDDVVAFLTEAVGSSDPIIVKSALGILIKTLTTSLEGQNRTVPVLLEVFGAEMHPECEWVRSELIFALPYGVVMTILHSSAELTERILGIPESEPIDISGVVQADALNCKVPEETYTDTSLKVSKVIITGAQINNIGMLSLFMPYFTAVLQRMDSAGEWQAGPLESVKRAVKSVAALAEGDAELFNMLAAALCSAAKKHPRVFYVFAFEVIFSRRSIVAVWGLFFILASNVQSKAPELNSWKNLVDSLVAVEPGILRRALSEACLTSEVPMSEFIYMVLALVHRARDFSAEAVQCVHKIFLDTPNESVSMRKELMECFLAKYFASNFPEEVHLIIFPELVQVFSAIKDQEKDAEKTQAKHMLHLISYGVKTIGEGFGKGWACIYAILVDAVQDESLKRTVFEIVKIITDRMLKHLPSECLTTLQRLLCICCKAIEEENVSFQALFCIRDLTEYALTNSIPSEIQTDIKHATFCLLCSMSYDRRDDVRDSAIVQLFEVIYFCQKSNKSLWGSLIKVFLKRFLSAAVYAKEKEIYSGEHDNESSSDSAVEAYVGSECLCNGIGGCNMEMHILDEGKTQRARESAKKIILGVSNLVFTHFEEMNKFQGFYSLWKYLGRILVKFSVDPEMNSTVVAALKPGLCIELPEKYCVSVLHTVSDVCFTCSHEDFPLETAMELVKCAYKKVPACRKAQETATLFSSITHLLKSNTVLDSEVLTFLEAEAIEALCTENPGYVEEIKVKILLEWISLPQVSPSRVSEQFLVLCMDQMEAEILAPTEEFAAVIGDTIKSLLAYHKKKQMYAMCWKRALVFLQNILFYEARARETTHLPAISREILGLSEKGKELLSASLFESMRRDSPSSADGQAPSSLALVKSQEREMSKYLLFLEDLSKILEKQQLFDLYAVLTELWKAAEKKKMHIMYLAATKMLCHVFNSRKDTKEQSEEWACLLLAEYNRRIRVERMSYSFFRRQAVLYVLQRILDKKMNLPTSKEFLDELTLCMSFDGSEISLRAYEILHSLIEQK
ncbi:uncharacterized protein NEMAJ01_0959 [Nematocida major]|uniref:uncharacterized protein n=1 Tax=Nematocida major TaxID=1912982 RepID=UPI002007C97F|nr:uncharacterized protein NEMAJ01_0959 [Nematocida major]KAH9386063.1 hypothetical protein NEMAJ01_0959 [Nematocida major]